MLRTLLLAPASALQACADARGGACPASCSLQRGLVAGVSQFFNAKLSSGKFDYDVLKRDLLHQEKGKRTMRVDEDFKVALCDESIETKRAKSGRQMARCVGASTQMPLRHGRSCVLVPKFVRIRDAL